MELFLKIILTVFLLIAVALASTAAQLALLDQTYPLLSFLFGLLGGFLLFSKFWS